MNLESKPTTSRTYCPSPRRAFSNWIAAMGLAMLALLGIFSGDWWQPSSGTTVAQVPSGRVNQGPQDPQDDLKLSEFMQIKLLRSQNILEGLATRDFTMIMDATKEIHELTEGAKWQAIDSPEYRKLTEEFQTATDRLLKAAEKENLEGVALRFYDLSTRCIDCHEHLRSVGF